MTPENKKSYDTTIIAAFIIMAMCILTASYFFFKEVSPLTSDPTTPEIGDIVNCNKYTTIVTKNKLYSEESKEFGYELISQSNNHFILDYHSIYVLNDNEKNKEVWEALPLHQTIRINPIFCIDNRCLINQALLQNITQAPEVCSNCCKVMP